MQSLKHKTVSNMSYNALGRIVAFVFQGFTNIILCRELSANDYGIVGFAFIFIYFLRNFSDLGINNAVIQKKEIDEQELYTAFTLKSFLGIAAFLVTYIMAGFSTYFFDNIAVVAVIRLLALNFVINSFAFIPNVLLTRDLDFKKKSIAETALTAVSSLFAMVMALSGFKYWSIAIAYIASTIAYVIILNIFRPKRIKFCFDKKVANEFIKFGWNIFLSGIIVFALFNIDNFAVGTIKGSTQLGYYALAFNWGSMACTIVSGVILNVLFPTFSQMQQDRELLKKSYLFVLEFLSFVSILINMSFIVISKDFLVCVLGHGTDKWMPALMAFRILCAYGILRIILEPVGNVLMALGETGALRKANIIAATIELSLLYPVVYFLGIEGVAILVTLSYVSQYFIYYPYMNKEIGLTVSDLWSTIGPAMISILVFLPIFFMLENTMSNTVSFLSLLIKTIVSFSGYIFVYGMCSKCRLFKEAWHLIREMRAA